MTAYQNPSLLQNHYQTPALLPKLQSAPVKQPIQIEYPSDMFFGRSIDEKEDAPPKKRMRIMGPLGLFIAALGALFAVGSSGSGKSADKGKADQKDSKISSDERNDESGERRGTVKEGERPVRELEDATAS